MQPRSDYRKSGLSTCSSGRKGGGSLSNRLHRLYNSHELPPVSSKLSEFIVAAGASGPWPHRKINVGCWCLPPKGNAITERGAISSRLKSRPHHGRPAISSSVQRSRRRDLARGNLDRVDLRG